MPPKTASPASSEWRAYWFLPLVAALGYSASSLQIYVLGPFIGPLQSAFGWSRAEVAAGMAVTNIGSALTSPFVGALVDRFGPRRVALVGVMLIGPAIALLGAATGSLPNWLLLWGVLALGSMWVQASIWTSAVVSRFQAGRGLALAVTLSGASFAATVTPLLSTWLIGAVGWRLAFVGVGAIWTVVLAPLVFIAFRGAQDRRMVRGHKPAAAEVLPGMSMIEAMRRPAFYQLMAACGAFALCTFGIVVHFVPILTDTGATPMAAAAIASLIGLFAIAGRLPTGVLLDRFPGHLVGALAFLLPIPGSLLLLTGGLGTTGQIIAAVGVGLTLGAELDVMSYLVSRHFGLRRFGALVGTLFSAVGLGAAIGPFAAGASFDNFGDYDLFLVTTVILMVGGAIALATLGRPPELAPTAGRRGARP